MSSSSFVIKQKESPFQRHKREEEEKKRRADAEAAQVYEDFVASFNSDDAVPGGKTFVRGGVVEPGSRPSSEPVGRCSPPLKILLHSILYLFNYAHCFDLQKTSCFQNKKIHYKYKI